MRQTHEVHQNNQLGAPKSLRFIQAVEEHIQRTLGQDGDLRISRARCEAKDNRLENKETAASEISDVETGLKLYEDQINKKVYEYRTMITHQVVFQDYDKESKVSGNDFSLNTWILQKGVPLHPVSTRFFLYETKLRLTNKLRELRQNNDNLRKRIKGYAKAYDLEETEQVEDAKTRLEQTLDQGLISRLINNKFKDFIQTYKEQSIGHLRNLDNYKKELLTELVFQSVLEHIESLIEVYETFFINLRDVKVKLEKTIQQKARQFEEKANPTEEYVLATKELQEELWKRIRAAETDDLLPDDISREIYVNLYDQFYQREKLRFKQDVKGINVEQFYHDHVVNYCYNKLKNDPVIDLDYDVITALRKEAQFLQKDEDAHIEERVHRLNHLAYPFIPNINNRRELKFWGVHDDIKEQLSEVDRTNLFAENAIFDPAFSKYEIVRYTAHYGLEIHDFSKFSDGEQSASIRKSPGVYYESYYRTISKLNRGEPAVTPHLDKNWHLPAYMPDLNPSQKELDERKINRAFLLGLMYDLFQVSKEQGEEIFLYTGGDYSSFIVQGGKRVPNQLYSLHEALFFNPAIYDEILDIAEETMEKNRQQYLDMEAHRFIQGAKKLTNLRNERINNIFDVVFHYEMEKIGDPKLEERAERLREQLLEEIKNYYGTMYGNQQRRAMQDAAKLIETLWNESAVRKTVDPDSARYIRWKTQIEREFADFQVRL